jgi:hypothetical protein
VRGKTYRGKPYQRCKWVGVFSEEKDLVPHHLESEWATSIRCQVVAATQ